MKEKASAFAEVSEAKWIPENNTMKKLPAVVIVGFPNVGKSTLFNRILHQKKSLVHSLPGMTRDCVSASCRLEGKSFRLIDTGGLFGMNKEPLSEKIWEKAWAAARSADVILFVLDGQRDLSGAEEDIYRSVKKLNKTVLVVVNKIDSPAGENKLAEYYRLGDKSIIPVSAEHNINIDELRERIADLLPAGPIDERRHAPDLNRESRSSEAPTEHAHLVAGQGSCPAREGEQGGRTSRRPLDENAQRFPQVDSEEAPLKMAIVGRINVGKSSLINRLCGEDKLLVSDIPGTTRDSTDTIIVRNGKIFCLVDTAGIRKFSGASDSREKAGIIRAKMNMRTADVIVLVMDVSEFPTRQDARVAQLAQASGKPLIIVLNKWDLADRSGVHPAEIRRHAYAKLVFVSYAPLLLVSAKTGQRVVKILDMALKVYEQAKKRIETSRLNEFLAWINDQHPPRSKDGSRVKIKYMTQQGVLPPTFVLFGHSRTPLSPAYEKSFVGFLRKSFDFTGTPIRLILRKS